MTLDLNYYKQIAERVIKEKQAERAEALRRKSEPKKEPVQEESQEREANPEIAENKKDYIYVPSLGLYISENRYLQNKNWNQTQEILHKENRRMPTIPEFIEFLKYLRSSDGKANVKNANKILDEIYKVAGDWRAEWLDAKFLEQSKGMYVNYHTFDSKGNIIQKQEKLETYLAETKTPGIDLESWLDNPTKQGLPKQNCKKGKLYYWSPMNNSVAWFDAGSGRAYLGCLGDPDNHNAGLGVRYVERSADRETSPKK